MKPNTVFVVHMLRYGNREKHSYIVGAFSTRTLAEQIGNLENLYRGGKYEPDIVECPIDVDVTLGEYNGYVTKSVS